MLFSGSIFPASKEVRAMLKPDDFSDHFNDPTRDHPENEQPSSTRSSPSTPESSEETLLTDPSSASSEAPGTSPKTIGPYRLVRKLGEGGMGQVWLAEQTAPFQRLVAIKLIRAGVSDNVLLERFESERQALARMNHPAIAKVYDAGATADGTPYFVMEYVPGTPITLYCDRKHLTIRKRLELFLKVCEGVQHAHQKAIIHRDLKPANILVTELDGKPTPHIIDFGIAKALADRDPLATMFTRDGHFIGTPGYMSPEQADPDVRDVDTRSDVYSLAVIFYELLTGSLPFDPTEWRSAVMHEALKRLREQDPLLPSIQYRNKVSTQSETASQTARLRSANPEELVSLLRGDLDWIAMKGLERDRVRRYGTPGEFAGDVQRFLQHEPITARPASAAYRFQKYARRHLLGVSVTAVGLALLVAFAILQAVQIRRITAERDRTARERDRANRIGDFMTNMFKVSDPSEARGNSITARELLDKTSKEIDSGLAADPQLQAQMMIVMGSVYRNLGLYPQSESLLTRALEIRRRTLGPENPDTIAAGVKLAATLADAGKLAEAETLLRTAVEVQLHILGPESRETLLSMNLLASTLHEHGQYAEAEKMYRKILETQRRLFGPEDPTTLTLMSNIAAVLNDSGSQSPEIEQLNREVFATRRRVLGPDHPDTLRSMANLGIALTGQVNRTTEAEQLLSETLAIQRRVLGSEHPDTLGTMGALTSVLELEERYPEEEKLAREVLEIQRRVLGPEHSNTIATMVNLAGALALQEHYAEADKVSREALELEHRTLLPDHLLIIQTQANFLDILESEHHLQEASQLAPELLEKERRVLGPDHPNTIQTLFTQAKVFKDLGRLDEAEAQLRQTREVAERVFGRENPRTALCTYTLACIAALRGKRTEAISLLGEALDHGLDHSTARGLGKEPDLKLLRGDPRFEALVARGKQPAEAQQK
jgi:eukaryotic-like serine/threonine-protein kinase